ncbi:MAG TPA: ABC transporter ATP-binding protein [Chitinophagaceae bacterium]|mgnify:CR=1 FL=1|nr:ABC transporter ATP-binding protein [Chitinophagaceae bacterium]HPH31531.1 ABC transporter ATP-binding protein [Chitinophagaceae bacterium]HPN59560.1 ABC transporter ATP-binding protein [Chitinophagaceae bacterium]
MSEPIIKVEGLGKKYIISHEQRESYTALRDVISRKAKSLTSRGKIKTVREDFWALKDVNFEINPGEAVGIIGRNGAGKSTLLKVLSRITEPSTGRIEINGRIASLLEVGTGFHPELTGRENVFLNGAILGMTRSEIRSKFDEIVAFSGVEKFLDTPVKRYSSGMYVRLAFAVAAHLEPEILVVDEVLAVGDAEFQNKCLGKMNEVSHQEGRTVLFVSHNMRAIQDLCQKSIYLQNGQVLDIGPTDQVIEHYLNTGTSQTWSDATGPVQLVEVNQDKKEIKIDVQYKVSDEYVLEIPNFGFVIYDQMNTPVCGFNPSLLKEPLPLKQYRKEGRIQITMREPRLLDGRYNFSFWFGVNSQFDIQYVKDAISFEVVGMTEHKQLPSNILGTSGVECQFDFA